LKKLELGLYVITYTLPELGRGHLDVARAAIEGGADALQLRDKEMGGKEMYDLCSRIKDLIEVGDGDCAFFVNDRVDVAVAAHADGVHLGQEDLPAASARPLIGGDMVMGISATTVEEARRAQAEGADYLGVGPVFPTPSKPDAVPPIGVEGLKEISKAVDLPIVAIGGIDASNAKEVFEAGADGIAVISAVAGAEDMTAAVKRLRRAVDAGLARR
jgi:thiamine-phosphate pyrophosphorylase